MEKLWIYLRLLQKRPEYYHLQGHTLKALQKAKGIDFDIFIDEFVRIAPELHQLIMHLFDQDKEFHEEFSLSQLRQWQLLIYGQIQYPKNFYLMQDPPLLLMIEGAFPWLTHQLISVVGSREPQDESLNWMDRELVEFCRQNSIAIVSGGARGVDWYAHQIAFRCGLPSMAFLPSGLAQIYPSVLQEKKEIILNAGGCLLSEYCAQQKMRKHLFHHRNRLIAAASHMTLIIEAREKSGTMMTAHLAAEMGRPVFVVPGHPTSLAHRGSLNLLIEGAQMIRDAEDLTLHFSIENSQFYESRYMQ